VRRLFTCFVAALTLAAVLAIGGGAAPAGADGEVSPSYTCSVEGDLVPPITAAVPFTVEDSRDPIGVGGTTTYSYAIVLPELSPPVDINVLDLTVTFPVPAGVDAASIDLDTTGANPPGSYWSTAENVPGEVSATFTGNMFNLIQLRPEANGGGAVFPIAPNPQPVVLPSLEIQMTPGAALELSAIDINPPTITGHFDFFETPTGIECLPDDPSEVIATTDVCGSQEFSDVPPANLFFCDIDWMAREEITTGFPGGIFKPAEAVKRQSMSAFMYRLAGSPEFPVPSQPTFSDVPTNHPFYDEIEWMNLEGITTGFPGGIFKPNDTVKRQSMSAFMYRFVEEPPFTPPGTASFVDVATTHPFFKEIEWMADEGITTGFPGGQFRPGQDVTRQSMSAFMHRLQDAFG